MRVSLLIYNVFNFSHVMQFIRCITVNVEYGFLNFVFESGISLHRDSVPYISLLGLVAFPQCFLKRGLVFIEFVYNDSLL